MDVSQIVFAVVCALLGAGALLLVYMAARAGAHDGTKEVLDEQNGGKKK